MGNDGQDAGDDGFEHLFNSLPTLMLVVDPQHKITAVTDAFLDAALATRESVIGVDILDAFPDPSADGSGRATLLESLNHVKSELTPTAAAVLRYDVADHTPGGSGEIDTRYWSVTFSPILDDRGTLRSIVANTEDVTQYIELTTAAGADPSEALPKQLKRSQSVIIDRALRLQEANTLLHEAGAAKNEFLSRMSHELRTPLTAILGFSELLSLSDLAEKDQKAVQAARKGGEHLLELVNEVLDLARIESGRLSVSIEPVSPKDAISGAVELMKTVAESAGIELITADCELPDYVLADAHRLKQVLINLISNGVKFNHRGGSVKVSTAIVENEYLRIDVIDTGFGIKPESLEQLFTPFERLDAERHGIEGTGIGLTLTKRLVELMGGSISVESKVGMGSTFTVELKICEPNVVDKNPVLVSPNIESLTYGAERQVLFIEDKLVNIQLIQAIVERRPSVNLIPAMEGQAGVELAGVHKPDLILLDIHLPDIDGVEVLRRIRKNPEIADLRAVVLTADATDGRRDEMDELKVEHFLTKPITVDALLSVLDDCLIDSDKRR